MEEKLSKEQTEAILAKYAKIKAREKNQSERYRARVNLILAWAKAQPGYKDPTEDQIKKELARLAANK